MRSITIYYVESHYEPNEGTGKCTYQRSCTASMFVKSNAQAHKLCDRRCHTYLDGNNGQMELGGAGGGRETILSFGMALSKNSC